MYFTKHVTYSCWANLLDVICLIASESASFTAIFNSGLQLLRHHEEVLVAERNEKIYIFQRVKFEGKQVNVLRE